MTRPSNLWLKCLCVLVSVALMGSCSIHDSLEPLAAGYKRDSYKESYSMGETDTRSVAAGDVDGDGDIDLVFGNGPWPLKTQGADKLLLNAGDGVFGTGFWIAPQLTSGRVTECVVLADMDADGDLDLVCSYGKNPTASLIVFENLGVGRFVEATDRFFPRGVASLKFLAVGDMDGDLDLDLVGYEPPNPQAGTSARLWVYYNESGAYTSFRPVRSFVPPKVGWCSGITLADLDGDSRLDILLLNWKSRDRLLLRNGAGGFVDATIKSLPPSRNLNTTSAVTGDVDGDGDQDIVFGEYDGPNRLCLNDGHGIFTNATDFPSSPGGTETLAMGDVDGDGDLDLLVGNGWWSSEGSTEVLWSDSKLLINSGNGTFTDGSHVRLPVHLPRIGVSAVTLIDIDGDMDLDVVVGRSLARNQIWINDGNGSFHEIRLLK